jgi:cell division protein FtsW
MASRAGVMDRTYFLTAWACVVTGIVFVFSASYPVAGRPDASGLAGNPYRYLLEHSVHVVVALVAMLLVSFVRPQAMRRWSGLAFALTLVLVAMTFTTPWGVSYRGAPRWLHVPPLPPFQPSELAKVAFIAFLASILARKDEQSEERGRAYWQVLMATAIVAVLLLKQLDQGMASVFVGISLALLFLAGASLAWLGPLTLALLGGGLAVARLVEYRWDRIIAFLDPEKYMDGAGYHNVNMLIALSRGGVFGMGLGMSPDKWRSLPAPHTDSIFCVIGGELGFIGGMIVLLAVGVLTYQAVKIARAARSPFAWYLTLGVTVALCLQSLVNIAVATSCMPCTGLTLPFMSAGGTSLVSASVAAGMVLSVSRHCNGSATGG